MRLGNLAKILIIGGLIFLTWTNIVQAGFGVSPPKVLNRHLLPGSHFEQTIYLVRSEPEKDLLATLEIDAPEVESWLTIENGLEFTMPSGVQMFPLKVNVDVPSDAEFKTYSGRIWVKTRAKASEGQGMVSIGLGALITIDLAVSTEEVRGFIFQSFEIPKLEEGWPIKVLVSLQNTGNVKDGPSKIVLNVFDQYHSKKLQSSESTDFKQIKPFSTGAITAKFSNKLEVGTYWGDVIVYKDGDIIIAVKTVFHVVEKGTLSTGWAWLVWTLIGIAIIVGLILIDRWLIKKGKEGIFKKAIYILKSLKEAQKEKKKRKLEQKLKKLSK